MNLEAHEKNEPTDHISFEFSPRFDVNLFSILVAQTNNLQIHYFRSIQLPFILMIFEEIAPCIAYIFIVVKFVIGKMNQILDWK